MSNGANKTPTESENIEVNEESQDSDESLSPVSPQESTEPASENTVLSEPVNVLPGVPEALPEGFEVKSTDTPPFDFEPEKEVSNEVKVEEKSLENIEEIPVEQDIEPMPTEPAQTPKYTVTTEEAKAEPETQTAQMGRNEPFDPTQDKPLPVSTESFSNGVKTEPATELESEIPEPEELESETSESVSIRNSNEVKPKSESVPENSSKVKPEPEKMKAIPVIIPAKNSVSQILAKAQLVIQNKKRKKLEKIMALFLEKQKITNDEVEKFLHVSDATATRYLSILKREGKIKQSGKTGKGVSYSRT